MTDKEKVIGGLECCCNVQSGWKDARYVCPACPYTDNGIPCETLAPLMEDALSLLKAQEPMEPVFNAMVETDMSYWSCGACGAFIYGNAYPHMVKDTMPKYCGYCGRTVKWE